MSIDFDHANYCSMKKCTNLLTAYDEYLNKLCYLCQVEEQEEYKKQKEERDNERS